ncbi:MAG: hypothetical protein GX678_06760, partial [Actinomycetales bacterium]|nr:hypothetical protein [Actinomycetales bacterium]
MDIALVSSAADHAGDTDLPQLISAAEAAGHTARIAIWDDPNVDWSVFDVVAIRSCWDYTTRRDEFVSWCQSVGDHLVNSARVIEWNSDKIYLSDLADAGISIIPTIWDAKSMSDLGEHRSWVVKPTISSGSANTAHWTTAEAAAAHSNELLATGRHTMTQPYVASIDTVGEFANYFFSGEYSHTVRKPALLEADQTPAEAASFPGGLRVVEIDQTILEFSHEVIAVAERVTGERLIQARVDVVLDDAGQPMLMELELVEPALFIDFVPKAAETYIEAIAPI